MVSWLTARASGRRENSPEPRSRGHAATDPAPRGQSHQPICCSLNNRNNTIMADIENNYQIKYSEKWGSFLQQEASRLDKYVTVETGLSGKMVAMDQYGLLSFTEKQSRMQSTEVAEAPTVRRVMYPHIYTKAVGFS